MEKHIHKQAKTAFNSFDVPAADTSGTKAHFPALRNPFLIYGVIWYN
jgi:hypothetical protein